MGQGTTGVKSPLKGHHIILTQDYNMEHDVAGAKDHRRDVYL